MNINKNARLTPPGRERLAKSMLSGQMPEAATQAAGVRPLTARKRLARFKAESAAAYRITLAAEHGYVRAQTELARMYKTGDHVTADPDKMLAWYKRAADSGDVGAQLFVADGYAYGVGVAPDTVEAYKWYEIAIQYWGPLAVRARDVVAERMTADQVAEAVQRAGAWLMEHGTAPAAGAGTQ